MERVPERPFLFDDEKFAKNLQCEKRCSTGPSSMTTQHLFPLLESTNDTQAFCQLEKREDDISGKTKRWSARNFSG